MFFLALCFFLSFLGVFAGKAQRDNLIRPSHRQHQTRLVPRNCNSTSSKTFTMTDYYHGNNFLTYVPSYQNAFVSRPSFSFTSEWDFFADDDPTHGNVQYQTKANAIAKGLAFVQNDGTTVLAVDDKNTVPVGGKRDSSVFHLVSLHLPIPYPSYSVFVSARKRNLTAGCSSPIFLRCRMVVAYGLLTGVLVVC